MRKGDLKRLYTVGFQAHDILEKGNYADHEKMSGWQGLGGRAAWAERRGFQGSEDTLSDNDDGPQHVQSPERSLT